MVSHTLCVESTKRFGYIKRAKDLRILGALSTVALLLLSAVTVFPITDQADDVEAAYIPASIPTINITSASNIASVDITPNSASGTFVSSSSSSGSEVTFGVTTDNLTGYTVAVAANTGDTSGQLTNTNYGDTIDTISAVTTEADFRTGASTNYTNKWGIKPSKYNSETNTDGNFIPAPTTSELVLETTNTPNPTSANNYTIGLGARVDYTKPTGTYTNTFVLTAVGNPISYQINYDDTTADTTVTNIPADEGANDIEASGFTLSSTTPERTGYTFAGWCDGTVTHTASGNSTCAPDTATGALGTTYAAGASYNFSSVSGSSINTANLHAMWNVNKYNLAITFAGSGVSSVAVKSGSCSGTSMGTVSSSGGSVSNLVYNTAYYLCPSYSSTYRLSSWAKTSSTGTLSSTSAAQPTFTMGAGNGAVTITGQATTFAVAYSEAGKSLDSSYYKMQDMSSSICSKITNGQTATLRDRRTNDNRTYTVAKFLNMCWMTSNLNLPGNITIYNTDSNITASSYKLPASSTTGFDDDTKAFVYNSNSTNCTSSSPCYSYYSYVAATAGTGASISSGDATSDICPKGWRLPTEAELTTLSNTYTTGATLTAAPFKAVYAGFYAIGSFYYGGSNGVYWSSTSDDVDLANYLGFDSSFTNASDSFYKKLGNSIRCVANS